jgi:hypothetical protein
MEASNFYLSLIRFHKLIESLGVYILIIFRLVYQIPLNILRKFKYRLSRTNLEKYSRLVFFNFVCDLGSIGNSQQMQMFRVRVTVFNATFNTISIMSWRSVLLVEETEENH